MDGLSRSRDMFVGVDIGGTKVAVLVVDDRGQMRSHATSPTPSGGPTQVLPGVVAAIQQGLDRAGVRLSDVAAVGLGMPGRVDAQAGVAEYSANLGWEQLPARDQLVAALGVPCFIENDVQMAALGVLLHPDYQPVRNLAYVSIGTGIGAALILNGRPYTGARGMAGEIGHMIVDPEGPRCSCGLWGCLEAVAAGPAIARQAAAAVAAGAVTQLRQYQRLTAQAVYRAAGAGDAVARAITRQEGCTLAQALQQLVMAYDLERVVLGGGVARAGAAFLQPILEEIARFREASALAREMLQPEMFRLLPADYDAGSWGAVALAQAGLRGAPQAVA